MEDDTSPLGDVAGGAMVEAGGGEQTGTVDRQNKQSSTNSSKATKRREQIGTAAEQHGQRKGATLRRGAEGSSTPLYEVSRRPPGHPSAAG